MKPMGWMTVAVFFGVVLAGGTRAQEEKHAGGAEDARVAKTVGAIEGIRFKTGGDRSSELEAPVRLEAGGKFIDTNVGHAAPFVGDMDGDGIKDLLVGQFGDGLLWIYKNIGSDAKPVLAAGVKFKDGNKDGRVPTG